MVFITSIHDYLFFFLLNCWDDLSFSINFSGANAQNNSGGAISQSSMPGKPVVSMPATNLNIGMDLWNASSGGGEAAKMRHNQSGAPGVVALGEQWIQVWVLQLFFLEIILIMYCFNGEHIYILLHIIIYLKSNDFVDSNHVPRYGHSILWRFWRTEKMLKVNRLSCLDYHLFEHPC